MERLHYEEQHHKLHEETEQEIISDILDEDEERTTVREEISKMIGEFVASKSVKSAKRLEQNNEEEYQAYLRGEYPDPRD